MKCTNKECPCGLYDASNLSNCKTYFIDVVDKCPSYKPEEKKKREITVTELLQKGARFMHAEGWISPIIFIVDDNKLTWGTCAIVYTIKICCEKGLKWSTDGLNPQPFEVED